MLPLGQLGVLAWALIVDADVLLAAEADRIVTISVASLFGLQIVAAVAVLRLWRWWRGIAILLTLLGIALQVANLAGPPDRPVVVAVNVSLAGLYLIVLVLLAKSRSAFR